MARNTASRCASLMVVVMALSACAAGAPAGDPQTLTTVPTASPTQRPMPTPTPIPIDPIQAFEEQLRSGPLAFAADISGTFIVGEMEVPVTGSYQVAGGDSHIQLLLRPPIGAEIASEQLYVNGRNYLRSEPGPWIRDENTSEQVRAQPLGDALAGATFVKSRGRPGETDEGHRLVAEAAPLPLVLQALGLIDRTTTVVGGDIEAIVDDAGRPVILRVSADVEQAGIPNRWVLEYHAKRGPRSIAAPEEPWRVHSSERFGYRMAYPEDWDVMEDEAEGEWPAMDVFVGPVSGEVQVIHYTDVPSEAIWYRESAALLEQDWGQLDSNEAIEVGGEPARLLTVHGASDEEFLMQAIVIRENTAWDINWFGRPGDEVADRERFELFLSTFAAR